MINLFKRMFKTKKRDIFCNNCKWFKDDFITSQGCNSPNNMFCREKRTHVIRKYKYSKYPYELNKNNDCKWFKEEKCIDF